MANGWTDFEPGALLFSFKGEFADAAETNVEDRPYSEHNSHTVSVADWRVEKPVYNRDFCIDCQFCWLYCPDMSIIAKDKKMTGIDYVHCKGCGICADVCPTNPKSLIMVNEKVANDEALNNWPKKDEKESE